MQTLNKLNTVDNTHEDSNSQLIQSFVGKNYLYYNNKWNILKNKKNLISINWVALFFGPIWFAYRKMYLYLFSFYGSIIMIDIILSTFFKFNFPLRLILYYIF